MALEERVTPHGTLWLEGTLESEEDMRRVEQVLDGSKVSLSWTNESDEPELRLYLYASSKSRCGGNAGVSTSLGVGDTVSVSVWGAKRNL